LSRKRLSSMTWSCLKAVIKPALHILVPNVQWKTHDDGKRNCPKHVEFLDKNKFGKLVRLLVILKLHVTKHGHMNLKLVANSLYVLVPTELRCKFWSPLSYAERGFTPHPTFISRIVH
jgi:hypothetical protein